VPSRNALEICLPLFVRAQGTLYSLNMRLLSHRLVLLSTQRASTVSATSTPHSIDYPELSLASELCIPQGSQVVHEVLCGSDFLIVDKRTGVSPLTNHWLAIFNSRLPDDQISMVLSNGSGQPFLQSCVPRAVKCYVGSLCQE
jgi:hypothetical protein